jgi:hypothetical protein
MYRKLVLALVALPMLAALSGCVVYAEPPYYHHHYWHDRY